MQEIRIKDFCKKVAALEPGDKIEFCALDGGQRSTVTRMSMANIEVLLADRLNGGALFSVESRTRDEARNTILLETQFSNYLRQCGFRDAVFISENI